ncbi:MAG: amidohydrolase family protein [Acidobacteria bacterium]|nr:amidohydrolase family protein [Acidobacteriota bacterium]
MNAYIALTRIYLRLTLRDRAALFFTYLMPLMFFFLFGELNHAERGMSPMIVNMVLTIGILGTGLFGAGMRATVDRETNILRRFKVAPISPAPILFASMVVGLANYIPVYVLILTLANRIYAMPLPPNLVSLTVFVLIGVIAFRAIGLMAASVANSSQEAMVLIQSLYMPMLFLSGATIPLTLMPNWVQIAGQFLPATHLFTGMQAILGGGESILRNLSATGALLLATVVGAFISIKLFRWEKQEKLKPAAKLWVLAVLAPFVLMGAYQTYSKENLARNKVFERELSRKVNWLVRNVRIVTGDGGVIENGSVLVRDGKIAEIYTGEAPSEKELRANEIDGAGKTLLPGLIDVHVHLGAPGGMYENPKDFATNSIGHALSAYLYSGVTAVRSLGDLAQSVLAEREKLRSGSRLGAEVFLAGPLFTVEGGHGTEYFKQLPEAQRKAMESDFVRTPHTAAEAAQQVAELKQRGVDAIKAVMEAGGPGRLFNRMDASMLKAIGEAARAQQLPLAVHTGTAQDITDALDAGASSIEHGSSWQAIPESLFARMKQQGAAYDPTLTVYDGVIAMAEGRTDPIDRSLVQQVGPAKLLAGTRTFILKQPKQPSAFTLAIANANLLAAYKAGVTLVTGSDAGNPPTVHGPTVHREMQLWVQAGIPPAIALEAATFNAAKLLGAGGRMGAIRKGYEATFIIVDGNPLKDIGATERISTLLFKGERIRRQDLFDDEKSK